MPEKKPNKTQIMTLTIAGAGLIIVILVVLLLTGGSSKNTGATTNETGATAKASSSSSSNQTYVEGKDYSIKYSNDGIVDKATLDKAINVLGFNDSQFLIGRDTGSYSKIDVFYNKEKGLLVSKNYKVGNTEPDSYTSYSIKENKVLDGRPQTTDYENMPVVYTWTNLTK
ncbi:MAG: alanyl-tRNA synthetase [Leuconostoc lactis]|uniref:alanyl-tRNA synthetase n=1 Tax=Leuconostoc lactis TaxID=1246 RepID=UPI003994DF51